MSDRSVEPKQEAPAAAVDDAASSSSSPPPPPLDRRPLAQTLWPVMASGAGLFSDGYINNVIGSVSTALTYEYGAVWTGSTAYRYVADVAFAGTVVGMLGFGYAADRWSRTGALLLSTALLVVFAALAAAAVGAGGDARAMFDLLAAWRFFVGVGIGGEYPAGSVGCAEASGGLRRGTRNMWFILFTNSMIDWGFVFGAFVPYVVAAACRNGHFGTIWRTSLGIGVVFPLVLFLLRLKLKEPEEFNQHSMKNAKTPVGLVFRHYGFRLFIVGLVWFLYDFSTYAFGLYSSSILSSIYGSGSDRPPLTTVFGWNTVINLFYIPGTMLGAPLSDRIGPRWALIAGVTCQSAVGFVMAGCYAKLARPEVVAAFAVVYGIFLALGELGPGNNIGLLAAKTCATGIRGQYYGLAAAVGKIGAFVGVWVFPYIQAAGGADVVKQNQYPFWVASCLCLLSAALVYFCLPEVGQDTIAEEDARFRAYLEAHGWDTRQLGIKRGGTVDDGLECGGLQREPLEKDQGRVEDQSASK